MVRALSAADGRGRGGGLAAGPKTLKQAVTASGSRHPVSDVWDVGTIPGVGAPGGCLVAPIGERWSQRLRTVTRKDDGLHTVDAEGVGFVPLLAGTRC